MFTTELDGKRQDILLEAVPGIHRMAALADTNNTSPEQLQALQDGARARAVELLIYRVVKAEEIASAIDAAKSSGATALNVLASPLLFNNRQIILQRVAALGLPAIYQFPVARRRAASGYGWRLDQIYRDIFARQLVKLLQRRKARRYCPLSSRPSSNLSSTSPLRRRSASPSRQSSSCAPTR